MEGINMDTEEKAKEWLSIQIQEAIKDGKRLFITNTSVGICCLAAEIVNDIISKEYIFCLGCFFVYGV